MSELLLALYLFLHFNEALAPVSLELWLAHLFEVEAAHHFDQLTPKHPQVLAISLHLVHYALNVLYFGCNAIEIDEDVQVDEDAIVRQ